MVEAPCGGYWAWAEMGTAMSITSVWNRIAGWMGTRDESVPSVIPDSGGKEAVTRYFTQFLPLYAGKQWIEGLSGVEATVRFVVGDERWASHWMVALRDGRIAEIREDHASRVDIEYSASVPVFLQVTAGLLRTEQAFLRRQVKVRGNYLKGLKLAALLQEFFRAFPCHHEIPLNRPPEEEAGVLEEPDSEGWMEEAEWLTDGGDRFEARLTYPEHGAVRRQVVFAPPHPLLGATVDNPLLRYLSASLARQGCMVARFGYSFDIHSGESQPLINTFWTTSDTERDLGLSNLLTVWDWLDGQPGSFREGRVLMGYSYGCQVCLKGLPRLSAARLVLVSPVASQLGPEIANAVIPTCLVSASEDFATSLEENQALADRIPNLTAWERIQGADHFYRGCLGELAVQVERFLLR
jgi:alpha/beta superfamily hydrolase